MNLEAPLLQLEQVTMELPVAQDQVVEVPKACFQAEVPQAYQVNRIPKVEAQTAEKQVNKHEIQYVGELLVEAPVERISKVEVQTVEKHANKLGTQYADIEWLLAHRGSLKLKKYCFRSAHVAVPMEPEDMWATCNWCSKDLRGNPYDDRSFRRSDGRREGTSIAALRAEPPGTFAREWLECDDCFGREH